PAIRRRIVAYRMPVALREMLPHLLEGADHVVHVAVVAEEQAVVKRNDLGMGPLAFGEMEASRIDGGAVRLRHRAGALRRGPVERMVVERAIDPLGWKGELGAQHARERSDVGPPESPDVDPERVMVVGATGLARQAPDRRHAGQLTERGIEPPGVA